MNRTLLDYNPELHSFETDGFEAGELGWSSETGVEEVFSEIEEMKLAAEVLEVTDEADFDHFLGNLIGQAGQAVRRFVSSSTGQALGGLLKGAAKQALPMVKRALSGYVGADRGTQVGEQLTSKAGRIFGLELEGLSPEDKEFEVAKRFVRFAGAAVKNALSTPITAGPRAVAKMAIVQAAQRHAPGLLRVGLGAPKNTGHWHRHGHNIIVNF